MLVSKGSGAGVRVQVPVVADKTLILSVPTTEAAESRPQCSKLIHYL